jgi:RimJ/RimL family protein N-acetyltransferase
MSPTNPKASPVRLRCISNTDAEAITALLQGDVDLALQTASLPIPYTLEDARTFLSTADPRHVFAVIADDQLVGMAGMIGVAEPIEIGYWIGRKHWGKGYATCAVALLLQKARDRGASRIVAEVFPGNIASMRVLEKNGFRRRGEVVRDLPKRGGQRRLIHFETQGSGALKKRSSQSTPNCASSGASKR